MDKPGQFQFRPGGFVIEPSTDYDQADRIEALKAALQLVSDRTTEEILQVAHWLLEGDIIEMEGDTNEDND